MSSNNEYIARIIAKDATHNKEYTHNVAASLLALERRYKVSSSIAESVGEQFLEGTIDGQSFAEAYAHLRTQMIKLLSLAQQDDHYKDKTALINRLQSNFLKAFPEHMDLRAYYWEKIEDAWIDGVNTRRIFPLHYVFVLVWTALHDNEAFADNYKSHPYPLKEAQKDLPNRLLTFFNTLDENIALGVCSHGARNALVLCLNKIHPDVDLIEDIETALNVEFRRLLSKRISHRLDKVSQKNPDKKFQKALLGWIEDESGELGALRTLLPLDEKPLITYLEQHGIESYPQLANISHYQPLELEMPNHPVVLNTLYAVSHLVGEHALQSNQTNEESDHELAQLVEQINDPESLLLCDTALQKRLILAHQLYTRDL